MSSNNYMKREALIGKSVVSRNAVIVGTVSDLALSTDGRVAIQVQKKGETATDGSNDIFIGPEEIQAVGDVILLKSTSDTTGKAVPIVTSTVVSTPSIATSSTPVSSPTSSVSPPPPPGGSAPQSKTCQKCGYANSGNAKFCIKCGSSLS